MKLYNIILFINSLMAITLTVIVISLLNFASVGGRNTADDGFERDLQITELQAKLSNLEQQCVQFHKNNGQN